MSTSLPHSSSLAASNALAVDARSLNALKTAAGENNPQAARATVDALAESYGFDPVVGVVAMMQDKDAEAVLEIFREAMDQVVITQVSSTPRARPVDDLAALAETVWSTHQVHRAATMAEALELAVMLADTADGQAGVLVAGSVIAAGEARDLLVTHGEGEQR